MIGSSSPLTTWARNITRISGRPGISTKHRGGAEEEGEQPVERWCLPGAQVEAALEAERLGGCVRAGQGDDAEAEECGAEQAEREHGLGGVAGERAERLRGRGGVRDAPLAVRPQGRRGGDHDEGGDRVGQDRAERDVEPRRAQVLGGEALVGAVGLDERLPPRRDRRPDRADDREQVGRGDLSVRRDQVLGALSPVGLGEDRRDDVGNRDARADRKEDVLDAQEPRPRKQQPDHQHRDDDRHRNRHAEEREGRADPGELGQRRAEVRQQHRPDRKRRPADPEPLPDEVEQPAPGRQPEPRTNLLRDEQSDHARQHHPEQRVAELRAHDRVGRDPAGVIVSEPAHQTRTEHGQERQLRQHRPPYLLTSIADETQMHYSTHKWVEVLEWSSC